MREPEETITLRRDTLKQALLEMAKEEVRATYLLSNLLDRLNALSNDVTRALDDAARPQAQTAIGELLLPAEDWAKLVSESQVAVWEAEFEAHYFAGEREID